AEPQTDEWVDVNEIARRFSLSEDWVYAHADELGALRLGDWPEGAAQVQPADSRQAADLSPAQQRFSARRIPRRDAARRRARRGPPALAPKGCRSSQSGGARSRV